MAVASIASQMGITASPIAAAITSFIAMTYSSGINVNLINILTITFPATLVGMLLAALWSIKRGQNLEKDPEFLKKMEDSKFQAYVQTDTTSLNETTSQRPKYSLVIFLLAVFGIVAISLFNLRPVFEGNPLSMTLVVQLVMLTAGALILLVSKVKPADVSKSTVLTAGMVALVAIFGIAWMSSTFVKAYQSDLVHYISNFVAQAPWSFAIAMFIISAFVKSQAATLAIMIPIGLSLQIPIHLLIGMMPACYAYFFFCFYPSDLAAINFDRTGTTRIGKYLFNHSFMIPGLIGVISATIFGYLLSSFLLG